MDFRSFRYTVQRDDRDADGIGIAANALSLNGETIRSADDEDAILDLSTHAIGNDPDRKVDGSGNGICGLQLQGDGYTVCYDEGYRSDAEFVRDVLNPASVRFRARYGPSSTAVQVKLYAEPGELGPNPSCLFPLNPEGCWQFAGVAMSSPAGAGPSSVTG